MTASSRMQRRRQRQRAPVVAAAAAAAVLAAGAGNVPHAHAHAAFVPPRHHQHQHQHLCPLARVGRGGATANNPAGGTAAVPGAWLAPLPSSSSSPDSVRQRGQIDARLSFRRTGRRLFDKVKDLGKTALWGERGRYSSEIPHDEVTYRRRGPDSAELTSIPQPERYSSQDWMHNILNLPGSQVLQRVRVPIICNMLWALLVSYIFKFFNLQPIPSRVHTLLGSSLGLLLVFRTNTSYGRYWEGRSLWEKLHNKARDLARAVSVYEDCIGAERVTAVGRLICAYPLVLREHLTGENHKPELARLLGPQLSDTLDCSANKPLWLCNRLSVIFRSIPEKGTSFSSRERLMLLGLVNDLSSIIGSCERLVQTPVPLSYARHTSRFLTLYLWSLPMVLVGDFTGPVILSLVSGFVCWCLFGILEIGLLIEDPFQRVLRTSWTAVIADSVIRDVQWSIAENRRDNPAASAGSPSSTGLPY